MININLNFRPILWTTIIVSITMTVFGNFAHLIERKINSDAYLNLQTFFRSSQPDYYPLLYLVAVIIMVFSIVLIFALIRSNLNVNWIIQGIIVGIFIFVIADLLNSIVLVYTTVLSIQAVKGMTIAAFINKLINGLVLTYTYNRFSDGDTIPKSV